MRVCGGGGQGNKVFYQSVSKSLEGNFFDGKDFLESGDSKCKGWGSGNRLRLWQHHRVSGSPTTLEIGLEPTANTEEEEELAPRLEEVSLGLVKSEVYRQVALVDR